MQPERKLSKNQLLPPNGLKLLIVIFLGIGIFFRFTNLDYKVYSNDEAITSLRISGYTWTEMVKQDFQGKLMSVGEFLNKYQQINPEKTLINTIKGLATEEPQLPPFYFTLARFWVQLFGPSVAATRSLSALISLFMFPSAYWLCLELFASPIVGSIAIIIMAVSPFQVLYGQEARPYILLGVIILLSSAALLRAIRLNHQFIITNWVIYAVTVMIGFYSHLLFALVAISHGSYLIVSKNFKFNQTVIAYLLSSLTAILLFLPWIFVFIFNSHEVEETVGFPKISFNFGSSFKTWILMAIRIFIDTHWAGGIIDTHWAGGILDLTYSHILTEIIRVIFGLLLLGLMGYSFYFLILKNPVRIWLFPLTLMGITAIVLVGLKGVGDRYLVACVVGIQLAVAYLLATNMTSAVNSGQQNLWKLAFIALLSSGIISCAISSQSQLWWNKYPSSTKYNPVIARIINQTKKPLLISQGGNNLTGKILSLSYLLKPEVQLQLVVKPELVNIPESFSDVFLYRPTQELLSYLKKVQNYQIKPLYKPSDVWLWRLEKKRN